ncbi:MAG: hypothetical protein ACT4OM_04800 [Actinomycetota bacterium]
MILFAVAATISFGAFVGFEFQRQLPFWVPAAALFALSIGREPSVVFLVLFILPTMILGVAALMKRISSTPFLVFAASDIVLGIAFSLYQSKTALWTLPQVGEWGIAGGGVAAAAAVLRLGGATAMADHREGGLASLGWWQGAMLAYWAGAPAAPVLVGGAILLWLAGAYYSESSLTGLTLAGGVVALAAGLGSGLLGVIAVGLAGTALALGERLVSPWMVGMLPLSLAASLKLPGGQLIALPALFFPAAWAALSARIGSIKPAAERLELLGTAAALVIVAYLAAVAEMVVGADVPMSASIPGVPAAAVGAMWLLLGAGAAAGVAAAVATGGYAAVQAGQFEIARPSQFDDLISKLVPAVGWFVFSVAVLVVVRLLLAGFHTGFL